LDPWKSQVIPTASLFKLQKMWSFLQMCLDATAKGLVWIQGLVLVQNLMALIFHMLIVMVAGEHYLTMDFTEFSWILYFKVLYRLFNWLFLHDSTFVLFFTFRLIEARAVVFECGPGCGCGPGCVNRTSQRGIKHRLEVSFISSFP